MKAGDLKPAWWRRLLNAIQEWFGKPTNVHYTSVPLWKPWRDF
jgi:hypothetical protein